MSIDYLKIGAEIHDCYREGLDTAINVWGVEGLKVYQKDAQVETDEDVDFRAGISLRMHAGKDLKVLFNNTASFSVSAAKGNPELDSLSFFCIEKLEYQDVIEIHSVVDGCSLPTYYRIVNILPGDSIGDSSFPLYECTPYTNVKIIEEAEVFGYYKLRSWMRYSALRNE